MSGQGQQTVYGGAQQNPWAQSSMMPFQNAGNPYGGGNPGGSGSYEQPGTFAYNPPPTVTDPGFNSNFQGAPSPQYGSPGKGGGELMPPTPIDNQYQTAGSAGYGGPNPTGLTNIPWQNQVSTGPVGPTGGAPGASGGTMTNLFQPAQGGAPTPNVANTGVWSGVNVNQQLPQATADQLAFVRQHGYWPS